MLEKQFLIYTELNSFGKFLVKTVDVENNWISNILIDWKNVINFF